MVAEGKAASGAFFRPSILPEALRGAASEDVG